MKDESKTNKELIAELVGLRRRVGELEASETERKRAEEALRRAEKEKTAILDTMSEHVVYQDKERRILWANRAAGESVGLAPQELVGRYCYEIWQQRTTRCVGCPVEKACKTGRRHEAQMTSPDGRVWLLQGYPVRDENGDVVGAIEVTLEITERARAQKRLQEAEQRFRTLFENVVVGLYRTTPDGRIVLANPALVRMLGYSSFDELAQRDLEGEGFEPEYPRSLFKDMIDKDDRVIGLESAWTTRNGTVVFVRESARAVRDEAGKILYYEGVAEDITERKRVEAALRESEKRYRALFEQAPDSIVVIDAETRAMVEFNDRAHENLGYTRDEFWELVLSDVETTESPEEVARHLGKVVREGADTFETKQRRKGGEIRDIQISSRAISIGGRDFVQGIWRDITECKRVGAALRESEERYRALFEQAPDAVVLVDPETGALVQFNDRAHENLGYTREELRKLKIADFEVIESAEEVANHLQKVVREGADTFDTKHRAKTGQIRDIQVNTRPIFVAGRQLVQSIWRDITERKRTHAALRESEKRYRALFEQAPDSILVVDAETDTIVHFNERAHENLGYTRAEFQKLTIPDIDVSDSSADVARHTKKTITAGGDTFETKQRTKSGEVRDILVSLRPISIGGKDFTQAIWRDITERKRAEEALRESEERYRALFEQAPDSIGVVDAETGQLLEFNDRAHEDLGYTREEFQKMRIPDFDVIDSFEDVAKHAEKTLREGTETFETKQRTKRGEIRDALVSLRTISIGGRNFIQAIWRDITERKRAEQALRESEGKYRHIFETTKEGIMATGADGRIVSANPAAAAILGYKDPEEMLGISAINLYDDLKQRELLFDGLIKKGYVQNCELTLVRKDGTRAYILGSATVYTDKEGNILQAEGVFRDITGRKRAEKALATEKERLAVTLQSIADAVIATDTEGKVVSLNAVAEEVTGSSEKEAQGKPLSELFHILDEKSRESRENPVEEVRRTEETVRMTTDSILIARNGAERIIAYSASPIRDTTGNTIGAVLAFHDITEKRKMEEEIRNAQKIEAIGVLAAGIAHDFSNILTGATGKIFLAKMHGKGDSELLEKLAGAEKAIFQAKRLTQQLLTFSKGGAPIKRAASVSELLKETTDFALSGSNVRPEFNIPDDLWAVEVDTAQISQVIHNLIINAAQAMPEGGEIMVSAENVNLTTTESLLLREGKYVKVAVTDHGIGIPKQHFEKIFDPYFTTKARGNGLGLATAYSIIDKHSGHIAFESKPGVGSTFTVHLPASEKEVPKEEPAAEKAFFGTGRVLLMDDEPEIRNTIGDVLKRLGYEADFAVDGLEAIERYVSARESGRPYDAVILDLTVAGGMGGKETIKKLRDIDPNVKALVSTGYSNDLVLANYRAYGFSGVVTKPYKGEELSRILREMITGTFE